jgi:hypothetical protein
VRALLARFGNHGAGKKGKLTSKTATRKAAVKKVVERRALKVIARNAVCAKVASDTVAAAQITEGDTLVPLDSKDAFACCKPSCVALWSSNR